MTEHALPIRVLVAKPGLDGHDRGAKVIARALRDAGMDVVYTGLGQTPHMIVEAAIQEDVDVVGLSILSGAHMTLLPKVASVDRGTIGLKVTWSGAAPMVGVASTVAVALVKGWRTRLPRFVLARVMRKNVDVS